MTAQEKLMRPYAGVYRLRLASEQAVAVLVPGALTRPAVMRAVRIRLEETLDAPIAQWHDLEPGDVIQMTLHALAGVLDLEDPHA